MKLEETMSISKLVTLEPSSPKIGGVRSRGKTEYSSIDVAAAMAYVRLHDDARYYVYVKHQCTPEQQLEHYNSLKIQKSLILVCVLEGVNWPLNKLAELTDIVVKLELFANRCDDCFGAGHIGGHSCQTCNGSGVHRMEDKEKAEQLMVSPEAYCRKWSKHEVALIDVLRGWEDLAHRGLIDQFSLED
ncbi:MAG: hypothetical protein ACRBHB_18060 [Arenicella sp.]